MLIGERLRALREEKQLSQADIEKRTGLFPSYISRIENGHTVPSIETLSRWAQALEVQLYELFYEGAGPPELPIRKRVEEAGWGSSGKDARTLGRFRRLMGRMAERDRRLLLHMAQKMARR